MSSEQVIQEKLDRILRQLTRLERRISVGPQLYHKPIYISEKEAMIRLNKSKATLQRMRREGSLKFSAVNGRNILYEEETINQLISTNSSS